MKRCPVCRGTALVMSRTRWWTKTGNQVTWRRAVQCRACNWRGWLTGSASERDYVFPLQAAATGDRRATRA